MTENDSLNTYRIDYLASTFKATAGMLPVIGPAIAELTSLIPGQRLDRVCEFVKVLDERIKRLEQSQDDLKSKFTKEGVFELFEEACEQAARTNSEARRKYLADIVAKGLVPSPEFQKAMHFLGILKQLNDDEVLILISFWKPTTDFHKAFILDHKNLTDPSSDDANFVAFFNSYTKHLESLGMLQREYGMKWGTDNAPVPSPREKDGYEISELGNMFLEYVGIADEK